MANSSEILIKRSEVQLSKRLFCILRTFLHRILLSVSVIYVGLYVLWRILLLSPLYDVWWPLSLSDVFGSWFYLPLLLLLPLALITRDKRILAALLIPIVMFGFEYGRQFLPNWQLLATDSIQRPVLRVMTWNMAYTIDTSQKFYATIEEFQPDIVVLQEVSQEFLNPLDSDWTTFYPYQIHRTDKPFSNAILSRYPITESSVSAAMNVRGCFCIDAIIDFEGVPIRLLTVHAPQPHFIYNWRPGIIPLPSVSYFSAENQNPVFERIQQRIAATTGPLLLMGDLNTTERQPNVRRLSQFMNNAFSTAGWGMGYTYPNYEQGFIIPLIRIDHIFYNNHWLARRVWTRRINGSDHRYVMADLALIQ